MLLAMIAPTLMGLIPVLVLSFIFAHLLIPPTFPMKETIKGIYLLLLIPLSIVALLFLAFFGFISK